MDQIASGRELEEQDGAEQAFMALREEVAALRHGIEVVHRQLQEPAKAIPDYSLTLGQMQEGLHALTARLEVIEQKPALAATPGQQVAALRREMERTGEEARRGLVDSQTRLDATVSYLSGVIASARERERRWPWTSGLLIGALLWPLLIALLPWGGGTWLASLTLGGRWRGGQTMMRDASPDHWDRIIRLYNACPKDTLTEVCEAAMAGQAAQEAAKPSVPTPEGAEVPGPARGGAGH